MKSINEADITSSSRVLVRCDLDVPVKDGVVQETFRLDQLLPTLQFILDKGARPVICGHMGRPEGKADPSLSTEQLRPYFNEKLGEGNFDLLENLRFSPGENENSLNFAKDLSLKGDIFVNESFATCHRFTASMVMMPELMPSFAGFRLLKEVKTLEQVLKDPVKPLIAIIGGAKLKSKKAAVTKFVEIADLVLVGGRIGLEWEDKLPDNLVLPEDYARDEKDIGPITIGQYTSAIRKAKTVVWAGPLGLFEEEEFILGTHLIAEAIVNSDVYSVVGGGDTVAALHKTGHLDSMNFVSTGGGAMLEFIVKGNLPALESLGYHG